MNEVLHIAAFHIKSPCSKTKKKHTLTLLLIALTVVGWAHLRLVVARVRLAYVAHGGHLHGDHLGGRGSA